MLKLFIGIVIGVLLVKLGLLTFVYWVAGIAVVLATILAIIVGVVFAFAWVADRSPLLGTLAGFGLFVGLLGTASFAGQLAIGDEKAWILLNNALRQWGLR